MFKGVGAVALLASVATMTAACGSGWDEIDLALCEDVVKAAHPAGADFKTLSTSNKQTSQGIALFFNVSYQEAGKEQTDTYRCWFDTNNNRRPASFSVEKNGQFENVL